MKIPKELKELSKRDLIRKVLFLEQEVEELKRRLLAYENAHTPPSQQRKYPKRESSNNNIGAPQGHQGTIVNV